jgi:hypothetical protein
MYFLHVCVCICIIVVLELLMDMLETSIFVAAVLMRFEGQLQVFQRFSSNKLVLKTVGICSVTFYCYDNDSK